MNQTYKIASYSAIFPMIFSFYHKNDENILTIRVEVDYFNKKVYFKENDTLKYPEIDFSNLEEQILKELVPQEVDLPEISEEVYDRATQVRKTSYAEDLMKNMNGGFYDRGQS